MCLTGRQTGAFGLAPLGAQRAMVRRTAGPCCRTQRKPAGRGRGGDALSSTCIHCKLRVITDRTRGLRAERLVRRKRRGLVHVVTMILPFGEKHTVFTAPWCALLLKTQSGWPLTRFLSLLLCFNLSICSRLCTRQATRG